MTEYVAVATALFAYPLAPAMAWIVSDEETGIGDAYFTAGVFPLIRYSIVAPGVVSSIVTD